MKKTLFGIFIVAVAAVAYYLTTGSDQLTQAMKKQLDHELTTLQQNGFSVKERKIQKQQEHFTLGFDEPEKISNYFIAKGTMVNKEDMHLLKGMEIGVDAVYLQDTYSALSLDLYPTKLPDSMLNSSDEDDKKAVQHLNRLINEKKLLVHIDINKFLTSFKGNMKDIRETFHGEENATVTTEGFVFDGEIEDEKVTHINQALKLFSLEVNKEVSVRFSNFSSQHTQSGPSVYDSKSVFMVEKVDVLRKPDFALHIKNFKGNALSSSNNGTLLKTSMTSSTDTFDIVSENEKFLLQGMLFELVIDNLDISAFEALQQTDPDDEKAIRRLSQEILSHGLKVTIPNFSLKTIEHGNKTIDGFNLNSSLSIDKDYDIAASSKEPWAFVDALQSKTDLSVSTELFAMAALNPKLAMFIMLVPPAEKADRKVYNIEFAKGKLTVNGIAY